MSEKSIHWFPGHMQKALREIANKLKVVDLIVELADARAPFSTLNPHISQLIEHKTKILVLTKLDLADEQKVVALKENNTKYQKVLVGSLNDKQYVKQINLAIKNAGLIVHQKQKNKGIKPQPLKVMIIGIPNVGKSTLINKLAGKRAANVENRPGLTKAQQYIKVDNDFILIDTPGVLPPNYDSKRSVLNLALIGSIRQEILPIHELSNELLSYLKTDYLTYVEKRFNINITVDDDNQVILEKIASARQLLDGNALSLNKAEVVFLNEFKNGLIGKITLNEEDNGQ